MPYQARARQWTDRKKRDEGKPANLARPRRFGLPVRPRELEFQVLLCILEFPSVTT